ncbi:MAG: DUF2256 domain-containing protein [Opitutae bacterium]|nr:DUF2256 domain-containing protein [Opitutae bacterium]
MGQIPSQSKICLQCGRPFENRRKWKLRGIWDQILYCSAKCRKLRRNSKKDHVSGR